MDRFSATKRSEIMSRVRSKDTTPELVVRRLIHSLGFRFRLHHPKLPGHPDIVFVAKKKIILVHGCFWHRHSCRKGQSLPATNKAFWEAKLRRNAERDCRQRASLRQLGWRVLVVWECQLHRPERLATRIVTFLKKECCEN